MPGVPSFKGSLLATFVEQIQELVASQKISRSQLARHLDAGALEILDQPIRPAEWYDFRFYGQFINALRELRGAQNLDVVRQIGANIAERLLKSGLYQQIEYLSRAQILQAAGPEERFRALARDLRLIVTLGASVFSFSRWESKVDPAAGDRQLIEITEATPFPDVFVGATEGFINRLTSEVGIPNLWRGARPQPDLIVFATTRAP